MFKRQEKTNRKIQIILKLDELKESGKKLNRKIKQNEGTITRWIYTICIAAVMAVAAIPAAYEFLGEDGLLMGGLIAVVAGVIAMTGYLQLDLLREENKQLRNDLKWVVRDRIQLGEELDMLRSTPDWK
jgi:hypothetical protein